MSKQKSKFSDSQRWAIWTAYGMKCAWCKKMLDFTEVEIDCVIPKSVSKIVLNSILKDYELGQDFSMNSLSNWVPACFKCVKSRAKGAFRPVPTLPGLFKLIRNSEQMIDAKIKLIEQQQPIESMLKQLVEKLERGEISREDAESIVAPFLRAVEGAPKTGIEFRLSPIVRLTFSEEGVRVQPAAEIRYEKFVDGMVEGGAWKKKSFDQVRDGETFREGRSRRPGSGA
jgi:hypothetical protein